MNRISSHQKEKKLTGQSGYLQTRWSGFVLQQIGLVPTNDPNLMRGWWIFFYWDIFFFVLSTTGRKQNISLPSMIL